MVIITNNYCKLIMDTPLSFMAPMYYGHAYKHDNYVLKRVKILIFIISILVF